MLRNKGREDPFSSSMVERMSNLMVDWKVEYTFFISVPWSFSTEEKSDLIQQVSGKWVSFVLDWRVKPGVRGDV